MPQQSCLLNEVGGDDRNTLRPTADIGTALIQHREGYCRLFRKTFLQLYSIRTCPSPW